MTPDALTELCATFLRVAGANEAAAQDTAEVLVTAEMMGITTHGIARVLTYGERLRAGGIDGTAAIISTAPAPAIRLIDGGNGLGPAIGAHALRAAAEAARQTGIGFALCRHSNHFGAMAPYLWTATRQGFAAVIASNATPMMAPPGGRAPLVGNNPLGFGFPDPEGEPVLLDMALSVVSKSRIRQAAKAGQPIPPGWATGPDGQSTTDPAAALKGLIAPIGGTKGASLALCLDMLCGLWSGAAFLAGIASLEDHPAAAQNLGQCFLLIDTARLMPAAEASARMKDFRQEIASAQPADPANPVRLPGARALASLRRAEAEGLHPDPELLRKLETLARRD